MTAFPVPVLPARVALSPAAALAVDVRPDELLRRWMFTLSPATRQTYRRSLSSFARWALGSDGGADATLALLVAGGQPRGQRLAEGWREHLVALGLSSATVNKHLAAISSIVKLARRLGAISWQLEGLAVRGEQRLERSGPPRQQVLQLVDHLEQQVDAKAKRDLALLRVLHDVGLRRGEATGLDLQDVHLDDPAGPSIWPRRKRNKERTRLALPSRTAQALRQWLDVRGTSEGPLFTRMDRAKSSSLEPLGGEGVRRMLRQRAKQAGIDAAVRPHGLRHSGASRAAELDLPKLLGWGGWSSLQSAKNYMDNLAALQLRAAEHVQV